MPHGRPAAQEKRTGHARMWGIRVGVFVSERTCAISKNSYNSTCVMKWLCPVTEEISVGLQASFYAEISPQKLDIEIWLIAGYLTGEYHYVCLYR